MLRHIPPSVSGERRDDVSSSGDERVVPRSGKSTPLPKAVSTPYLPGWYVQGILPPSTMVPGWMCCMYPSPPWENGLSVLHVSLTTMGEGRAVCASCPSYTPWEKGGLSVPHVSPTMGEGRAVCASLSLTHHGREGCMCLIFLTHHGREASMRLMVHTHHGREASMRLVTPLSPKLEASLCAHYPSLLS